MHNFLKVLLLGTVLFAPFYGYSTSRYDGQPVFGSRDPAYTRAADGSLLYATGKNVTIGNYTGAVVGTENNWLSPSTVTIDTGNGLTTFNVDATGHAIPGTAVNSTPSGYIPSYNPGEAGAPITPFSEVGGGGFIGGGSASATTSVGASSSPEFNYQNTYGQPEYAAEWHPDASLAGGAGGAAAPDKPVANMMASAHAWKPGSSELSASTGGSGAPAGGAASPAGSGGAAAPDKPVANMMASAHGWKPGSSELGAVTGGSGGASNVSRLSGEDLFKSLKPEAQKALADSFSNAGITAKDLTQGMVKAFENGTSLTKAVAAQTAANAASADMATAVLMNNEQINQALSQAAKELGAGASNAEVVNQAIKNLGGEKAAQELIDKTLSANENFIQASGTAAAAKELGVDLKNVSADALKESGASQMGADAGSKAMEANGKAADALNKVNGAKMAAEAVVPYKVAHYNYLEYVLLTAESIKGNEIDDATKEVTVKGAEPMQQTQGAQGGGASVAPLPSSEMAGTTIAGAASAMVGLLDLGKIDLSLLSTDVKKPEEEEETVAVPASSSASQAGVSASELPVQSAVKKMTTSEQREIRHRRALLLSEWAAASLQIGEGSNAISSDFYARAATFSAAASGAQGSMGGINTITDSDRFVLFELTRGAALSAVQLGLQGAANLNALDEVMEEPASTGSSGVAISGNSPQ